MNINLLQIQGMIDELSKNFQKEPDSYFSECELQYELYCFLKTSKEFNLSFMTNNGKIVRIVHLEYPSVNRVQLQNGKGYRVWFDLAILNPDFIINNSYQTVLARDERNAKLWGDNLLAAFEFKFFPKVRNTNISSVMEDMLKLSLCPEITHRYVLAFSSYTPDLSELHSTDLGNTKLYWITPEKTEKFL